MLVVTNGIWNLRHFPFNQNFQKLRPETEWNSSVQPEGPPFEVDCFFQTDHSDWKLLFCSKKFRFAVPLCCKFLEISAQNWMERFGLTQPENFPIYCSICHVKFSKFQTGSFGRMESAPCKCKKLPNAQRASIPNILSWCLLSWLWTWFWCGIFERKNKNQVNSWLTLTFFSLYTFCWLELESDWSQHNQNSRNISSITVS